MFEYASPALAGVMNGLRSTYNDVQGPVNQSNGSPGLYANMGPNSGYGRAWPAIEQARAAFNLQRYNMPSQAGAGFAGSSAARKAQATRQAYQDARNAHAEYLKSKGFDFGVATAPLEAARQAAAQPVSASALPQPQNSYIDGLAQQHWEQERKRQQKNARSVAAPMPQRSGPAPLPAVQTSDVFGPAVAVAAIQQEKPYWMRDSEL
jgi:nucleoid-associated protein YgaU